jgi:Septum formation
MAKGWKCARCSTTNDDAAITCSECGLLRGSAVIPTSYGPSPGTTSGWQAPGWQAPTQDPAAGMPPGPQPPFDPGAWSATAAAQKPLWRRIPIGWVIVAVLVFGGGIANAIFNASRTPDGEINKGGDLSALELRVGDCFDLKDPDAETIGEVTALPCAELHQYEIFFVGSMSMAERIYPSQEELDSYVDLYCKPTFYTYVGKIYAESELEIFTLFPTNEGWGDGDRSVSCAAHLGDGRLSASVKGSKR